MAIINILFISFIFSITLVGQNIKVTSIDKLNIPTGFNPQFTNMDSQIIFTSSNYEGLYTFDLSSEKVNVLSTGKGAGYRPLISEDGTIVFRTTEFRKGRKFHTLKSFDTNSQKEEIIAKDKRQLKIPDQKLNNNFFFLENSKVKNAKSFNNKISKTNSSSKAVYTEKDKIVLMDGDNAKVISPLGKGVYVWASLSNSEEFILFSYGNKGSFICDLSGNILWEIKDARYPRFSPDDQYVSYMIDRDDGKIFTASDIYVYSLTSRKSYKITNTDNKIEMYANWSNDGRKLIFHSTDGEILLANLEFQN